MDTSISRQRIAIIAMSSGELKIDSVITLPSHASARAPDTNSGDHLGSSLPLLGLGVYLNDDPKPAVLAALNHGYRCVPRRMMPEWTLMSVIFRHIDTARMYRNEQAVGEAVRESGVPRGQIFISTC